MRKSRRVPTLQEIYRKNWIHLRCSSDHFVNQVDNFYFIYIFRYFEVLLHCKFYRFFKSVCLALISHDVIDIDYGLKKNK